MQANVVSAIQVGGVFRVAYRTFSGIKWETVSEAIFNKALQLLHAARKQEGQ